MVGRDGQLLGKRLLLRVLLRPLSLVLTAGLYRQLRLDVVQRGELAVGVQRQQLERPGGQRIAPRDRGSAAAGARKDQRQRARECAQAGRCRCAPQGGIQARAPGLAVAAGHSSAPAISEHRVLSVLYRYLWAERVFRNLK